MKRLIFILFLANPYLAFAGHWEWHHAEKVWVNDDGSWHYKNEKLTGAWKKYIERQQSLDPECQLDEVQARAEEIIRQRRELEKQLLLELLLEQDQ